MKASARYDYRTCEECGQTIDGPSVQIQIGSLTFALCASHSRGIVRVILRALRSTAETETKVNA